ncbi:MAG TPA: pyridoxal-phosphate dependent enzyme [Candidatus Saccharimonadales bacterium]|nr:pyridoxal-phosphate dependent enzyme [Candidatus Saccharimonadales bacterium]
MYELEPALTLGEQHELDVASARAVVQDLTQLDMYPGGDASRWMRHQVSVMPEMYSEGAVRVTPLTEVADGVFAKDERQQVTGAFKPRGAFVNCWMTLEQDPSIRELAATSAGNHAQGVATFVNWHNQNFGWKLTTHAFMAETASDAKKQALRDQEAEIHDLGFASLEEARKGAQEFVRTSPQPAAEILPYAAPETIAGQGTIMTETLLQLWEAGVNTTAQPLVVRVGWGGGGLALGVAEVMKQLISKGYVHCDSTVVAVEEEYNDSGRRGLSRYDQDDTSMTGLFAPDEFNASNDGTAVQIPDLANIALAQKYRDEGLLVFDQVTKAQVGHAMAAHPGTEPAGALSIASQRKAVIAHVTDSEYDVQPIEVCVVSGGNLTHDKFDEYQEARSGSLYTGHRALGGYVTRSYTVLRS